MVLIMIDSINTTDNSALVTSKEFLSFETIAGGLFTLFVSVSIFLWNDHSGDFKLLRNDVQNIRQTIPTLATKVEMNAKFNQMDEKLDALILSVNTIQNTMATKADLVNLSEKVSANTYKINDLDKRVKQLEKLKPE